jgi:hypothetical protein
MHSLNKTRKKQKRKNVSKGDDGDQQLPVKNKQSIILFNKIYYTTN